MFRLFAAKISPLLYCTFLSALLHINLSSDTPIHRAPLAVDIIKEVDKQIASFGDTVTYTITVINFDSFTAQDVTVTDVLPTEVSFVSAVASQGTYDNNTGIWTVGDLTSGQSETLTITTQVAVSSSTSFVVTNVANVANPYDTIEPYASTVDALFALQRSCQPAGYTLIEQARFPTGGSLAVPDFSASDMDLISMNGNFYLAAAVQGGPGFCVISFNVFDITFTTPTTLCITFFPGTLYEVALQQVNDELFLAVGSGDNTTELQLYHVDPTYASCLNLLQAINTGIAVTTVEWHQVNGATYLAVGFASNMIQLYQLDNNTKQLVLIQTLILEGTYTNNGVVSVNDLKWQVDNGNHYLTAGLTGSASSNDNPLIQLYLLSNDANPQLSLINEVRSTIAEESVFALAWNTLNGITYLASGGAQPIVSPTTPEILRLYRLDGIYTAASLTEVVRVPTSSVDGAIHTVSWNGQLLAVGGLLGESNYSIFTQTEPLLLYSFSDIYGPQLQERDRVSTVVINGDVMASQWFSTPTTCRLLVTGAMQDNGTSGSENARVYRLCSPLSDLSITQTVDNNNPKVTDTITFTITVTNNDAEEVLNVFMQDVNTGGLTFTSYVASQGVFDLTTGLWEIGTLAPGASATITISAFVESSAEGMTIINTSIAGAGCFDDPYSTNNQASTTINVQSNFAEPGSFLFWKLITGDATGTISIS